MDDQHPFLKAIRQTVAERIGTSPDSEEVLIYINTLSNWVLLQLLAEVESKDQG